MTRYVFDTNVIVVPDAIGNGDRGERMTKGSANDHDIAMTFRFSNGRDR